VLPGCSPISKNATHDGLKYGRYFVVVDRGEHVLTLTPDGKFSSRFSRIYEDTGAYTFEQHGMYTVEGHNLWLDYELPDGGHRRAEGPMWIIWWGKRCYLVMPSERDRFITFAITHRWPKADGGRKLPKAIQEPRHTKEGYIYLYDGDWLLPVQGKPVIPEKN
jgi:hypothetical protein